MKRRLLAGVIAALSLLLPTSAAAQAEIVEYYGVDALGSVRVVFDSAGNLVNRMDYGPFGEQLAGSTFSRRVYAQLFRDGETGQDYAEARQYQSRTGRLNTMDPVYAGWFNPQLWNRYAYAGNNPLSFTDPSGRVVRSGTTASCLDPEWRSRCDLWEWLDNGWNPSIGSGGGGGYYEPPGGGGGGDGGEEGGGGGGGENPPQNPNPTPTPTPTPQPPVPPPVPPRPPVPPPAPPVPDPNRWPKRWECFKGNYAFSFSTTNDFFFGSWGKKTRTAVGSLTSGALARTAGTTTLGMAWRELIKGQGVANLGFRGTAMSMGANSLMNGVVVMGALEVGIIVGSGLDAAMQTSVSSCQ